MEWNTVTVRYLFTDIIYQLIVNTDHLF